MDLLEFRAAHPGLYDQAFRAGAESDRDRVATLFELGEAAGSIIFARAPIENGHSVADALPRLKQSAARSDATAGTFAKKLEQLGLTRASNSKAQSEAAAINAILNSSIEDLQAKAQPRASSAGALNDPAQAVADIVTGKVDVNLDQIAAPVRKPDPSAAAAVARIVTGGGFGDDIPNVKITPGGQ